MKKLSWHPPLVPQPSALALSGGGLRAALFQQGGFLALAMRQELAAVQKVGAISGGTLAALALRQAHVDVGLLPRPKEGWKEEDRQLAIVMHAQWYMSRLAARNIRMRALLSWKSVASVVLFGSMNLTRRFAEDINAVLGQHSKIQEEPFELRIGVHQLFMRAAADIVVRPDSNVGVLAAAAMTIPGFMESLVVEPLGPVCDGGVDDKTALDLLTTAGVTSGILVLDASTGLRIEKTRPASPMTSLLMLLERNAETLRDSTIKNGERILGWASLRDAHGKNDGLNGVLLGYLQNARTDLNHFSAVEQLALVAVGFVVTLQARGEARDSILRKASKLGRIELPSRKGPKIYPMAQMLEGVCRALFDNQETPSAQTDTSVLEQTTISQGLSLVLEKSSRSLGHDIRSKHPFFFVMGLLASAWATTVALSILVPLLTLLWIGALYLAQAMHVDAWTMIMILWGVLGISATGAAIYWARAPGAQWTPLRCLLAIIFLPALVPLVLTARFVVSMVQEGEGAWTLRYKQGTLGRLHGLLSFSDFPQRSGVGVIGFIAAWVVLFSISVLNPWFFAFCISPHWTNTLWHFDDLGWVGWVFTHVPLQPGTLGLLALEGLTAALFASARWVKRQNTTEGMHDAQ